MKEYGSVSDVFGESLKKHLDPFLQKEAGLETESGAEVLSIAVMSIYVPVVSCSFSVAAHDVGKSFPM